MYLNIYIIIIKNSEQYIPDFLINDCKILNSNFKNYFKSFYRDIKLKIIYDPITFYFGIIGLIFSLTGIIQVLQQANIITPIS